MMAPSDVLHEFRRYVTNAIPIRLIDVHTLRLVDRQSVRRHFEKDINKITEAMLVDGRGQKRDADQIREMVKERVTYAILSHRWLDEGEPTYKDMIQANQKSLRGPGYEKLKKFCEEAKRRGFRFAWSDTCCIDKSSSVELDESIRSMYSWYRNSTLCIVHLAQTTSFEDLTNDEWFKRGWTLQELLAPRKMKFFNKTWELLTEEENDKEDNALVETIVKITGIPADDVCDYDSGPWCVDGEMTWAATRTTTREEDAAYSLMGLFEVSMQVAYGEGAERAFRRLFGAILLESGSPSVLNFRLTHDESPALPKSPADYTGHPPLGFIICSLDMTLTGRGLRVPMIILPLELVGSDWVTLESQFRCPHYGINDIFVSIPEMPPSSNEIALGIFNYIPAEGDFYPLLPQDSTAYLLTRDRMTWEIGKIGQSIRVEDVSAELAEAGRGWKRLRTEGFITIHCSMPGDDTHFCVDFNHLETVYL